MRVITTSDGKPMCHHCVRPFERHPDVVRREELHAKLCAIEDDEHAARAFHFYRTLQAQFDQMETVWVEFGGFDIPEVGDVRFEGATFRLEPGASREKIVEAIDKWLIPSIKESMLIALKCLSPTLPESPIDLGTIVRFDPTWCPSTPSAAELYPSGYVRREDGTVEAA
jgi:hypothetical protein